MKQGISQIANASLSHNRLKSVHGIAKVKGIKTGKIDSLIKLSGFGSRLMGRVTSVEHSGDFYTTFGFGLKDNVSVQQKGIDLSNLISPLQVYILEK